MRTSRMPIRVLLLGLLAVQGAAVAAAADKGGAAASPASAVRGSAPPQAAATDGAARVPNARVLGITESALDYCRGIDPSKTLKLELQLQKQVKGVPQQALAKVRDSDEYRKAYTAESDFVAKVDEHNAKRICMQPLAKTR